MAEQILLSTTGTLSPVIFIDLGRKTFTHPTIDFDLLTEYFKDDIQRSTDIQEALDNGYITIKDENDDPITDVGQTAASIDTKEINHYTALEGSSSSSGNVNLDTFLDEMELRIGAVESIPNIVIYNYNGEEAGEVVPYMESVQKASEGWFSISGFPYHGSNSIIMTRVRARIWCSNIDTLYSLQVYDITNAQVITQIDNLTNVTEEIHDLGIISNLPPGEAIFEFRTLVARTLDRSLYLQFVEGTFINV